MSAGDLPDEFLDKVHALDLGNEQEEQKEERTQDVRRNRKAPSSEKEKREQRSTKDQRASESHSVQTRNRLELIKDSKRRVETAEVHLYAMEQQCQALEIVANGADRKVEDGERDEAVGDPGPRGADQD